MKVSGQEPKPPITSYDPRVRDAGSVRPDEQARSRDASTGPGGERVELSERAREVQRVREAVQAAPDTDVEKVERLRQAVARGTYHVPAEEIAGRLFRETLIDATL